MWGKAIKFVVFAIFLCVMYVVMGNLYGRKNKIHNDGKGVLTYTVKLPNALKNVYLILFIMGMILFVTFLVFKLKGNPSITSGNFRVALAISAIGLIVMFFSTKWRIDVNGDRLNIHRYFAGTVTTQVSEIERAEIGKKNELILYKDGKKLTTVNFLADNYETFKELLENHGKIK